MKYSLKLFEAAENGTFDRVVKLLAAGANPDASHVIARHTPLQAAAAAGHLEVVKVLVDRGADINRIAGDVPQSALEVAAIAGRVQVVAWLLQNGAVVPEESELRSLLNDLEKFGEHEIIALLLDSRSAR